MPCPEIELIRTLLSLRSGIDFGRHREILLENRLRRRMSKAGARSLYEYYRMITTPGTDELQALVDEVSIHETSFFRNPQQFKLLQEVVLPERVSLRLRQGPKRLRLLSAGCSTGQEPYSMAMAFFESVVLPESWDIQLLGIDISRSAIRHARRGTYTSQQVEGIPPQSLRRFFDRKGSHYLVRSWVRRGVEFLQSNILEGLSGNDFDAIFCRNVMIYFDRGRQATLVEGLARALAPGGYLFLGHTESLAGLSNAFRMVSLGRGIAYQKLV